MDKKATIRSYRDLTVWQKAKDLTASIYELTSSYPKEEMYGLTAQMRRSAVSIPSSIAEGFGRGSKGSFVQFLRVAQGSLKELETQLLLCERVGFSGADAAPVELDRCDELGKMLRSLIRSARGNDKK